MSVAACVACLLVLALTLAVPVAAQEGTTAQAVDQNQTAQGGGRQASVRVSETLQAGAVTIESIGDTVDRIEIAADCAVEKGATVTVADESGEPETFIDGVGRGMDDVTANIVSAGDQVIIRDIDDDGPDAQFGSRDGSEEGQVTDSTGIACGRDADNVANAGNDNNDNDANDDGTRSVNDLRGLSCAELLVLFRGEGQYGDASRFADSEVRARVEVCLEREIIKGTAADEDLPDTGGLSLLGLAVLGVVSTVAGLSVIRGGRR